MPRDILISLRRRALGVVVPLLLLYACTGCGSKPNIAPVRGKVLLDEKPLATGAVVTAPESGRGAKGIIKNGEFELGTFKINDGALVGTHKVAVVANEQSKGAGPEAAAGKSLIPQRYNNPQESGLTIEVKAGETNEPTLKLTSP